MQWLISLYNVLHINTALVNSTVVHIHLLYDATVALALYHNYYTVAVSLEAYQQILLLQSS
jgi:hypothetical protein